MALRGPVGTPNVPRLWGRMSSMGPAPLLDSEQLLELARDKTVAGRRRLTATVTDLFFAHGSTLTDRERALMTDILRQLIHDVEIDVRRALAERLAREPSAPKELVVTLANDKIEVAHPILLHSEVLQDPELIEIIHHRTLEHQLAIAMRRNVSETVSDALVQSGNVDVIKALLDNPKAHISTATLDYLAEQSQRVDTYQNPLLRRPELSPELAQRMYWWVSAALRKHILDNFDVNPVALDDDLEDAVTELAAPVADEERKAMQLAERLAVRGELTPALLVQTLRQGEVALFEAMLARMSGLRLHLLRRILFEPGGEALAIACKALGVEASTFIPLFLLTRKARPDEHNLGAGEATRILAFYNRIKPDAAGELLRKWQRGQAFLKAIWQLEQPRPRHATS
jgi:uncharacterized protein (DUF2336 family)